MERMQSSRFTAASLATKHRQFHGLVPSGSFEGPSIIAQPAFQEPLFQSQVPSRARPMELSSAVADNQAPRSLSKQSYHLAGVQVSGLARSGLTGNL